MWTSLGMEAEGCACALLWPFSHLSKVRPGRNTHHQCHGTMRSHEPSEPWRASHLFVTLPMCCICSIRLTRAGRLLWELTRWWSVGKGLSRRIALRHGPETQTFACGWVLLTALRGRQLACCAKCRHTRSTGVPPPITKLNPV